ncbi:hypothetical protein L484_011343 [Morus notabilis]|uniref:Uncharacterized protein n=1 Tax=Morus notabilis TaxID=981085 RepID=W9QV26_9ROSA|nr:hypothetical protein L484_011343 [Morus notabilis]
MECGIWWWLSLAMDTAQGRVSQDLRRRKTQYFTQRKKMEKKVRCALLLYFALINITETIVTHGAKQQTMLQKKTN